MHGSRVHQPRADLRDRWTAAPQVLRRTPWARLSSATPHQQVSARAECLVRSSAGLGLSLSVKRFVRSLLKGYLSGHLVYGADVGLMVSSV